MQSSATKAYLALGATVLAWASTFAGMRVALAGFSPGHVAFLRYCVTALVLLGIAKAKGSRLPTGRAALKIALVGAVGLGAYNVILTTAQQRLPAGTASVLIATAPIWMLLFAALIARERVAPRAVVGVALGFAGVVLIRAGSSSVSTAPTAILLALLAAALQAGYSLAQRPHVATHGALPFLSLATLGAAASLIPCANGVFAALGAAPAQSILAVLFLALVPGAFGYLAWAYASTRVPTAVAGTALYAVPPAAMTIALLVLQEIPSAGAILGGIVVLLAVALSRPRANESREASLRPKTAD